MTAEPRSLAAVARRSAGMVLGYGLRGTNRRVGLALVYHVIRDERRDQLRELVPVVSTAWFEAHLDHLAEHYRVVPAGDLRDAIARRRRGQRIPLAITFDDDIRSHVEVALPHLHARGLRATFFLCGASLDAPHAFWWERLQGYIDEHFAPGLPRADETAELRDLQVTVARMIDLAPDELRAAIAGLEPKLAPVTDRSGLRTTDVAALVGAGQEIGCHTRDHVSLRSHPDDGLDEACGAGRAELQAASATPCAAFAYPFGHVDARSQEAVRRQGFAVAFTTRPTGVSPDDDPYTLGRIDVSWCSPDRLGLYLSRQLWATGRGRR